MGKITIMLICSAGMSTSLLVSKMKAAAQSDGIDAEIFATAAADADNALQSKHPDILLVGPQVRYMLDGFREKLDIPVDVIDMRDYGMMNGENVLRFAVSKIKDAD